jgi:hypothetical protein
MQLYWHCSRHNMVRAGEWAASPFRWSVPPYEELSRWVYRLLPAAVVAASIVTAQAVPTQADAQVVVRSTRVVGRPAAVHTTVVAHPATTVHATAVVRPGTTAVWRTGTRGSRVLVVNSHSYAFVARPGGYYYHAGYGYWHPAHGWWVEGRKCWANGALNPPGAAGGAAVRVWHNPPGVAGGPGMSYTQFSRC